MVVSFSVNVMCQFRDRARKITHVPTVCSELFLQYYEKVIGITIKWIVL